MVVDLGFFTMSPAEYKAAVDAAVAATVTVSDDWGSVEAVLSEHPAMNILAITSIVSKENAHNDFLIE